MAFVLVILLFQIFNFAFCPKTRHLQYAVAFVSTKQYPIYVRYTGVLLTEKIALCTMYPALSYAMNDHCALLGHGQLEDLNFEALVSECREIQRAVNGPELGMLGKETNIAIVQIEYKRLKWNAGTAPLRFTNKPDATFYKNCFSMYWKNTTTLIGPSPITGPSQVMIVQGDVSSDGCTKADPKRELCIALKQEIDVGVHMLGVPVVCQCGLVGLVSIIGGMRVGVMRGVRARSLTFVKVIDPDVEKFITHVVESSVKGPGDGDL